MKVSRSIRKKPNIRNAIRLGHAADESKRGTRVASPRNRYRARYRQPKRRADASVNENGDENGRRLLEIACVFTPYASILHWQSQEAQR
jgi:hypothetical protein